MECSNFRELTKGIKNSAPPRAVVAAAQDAHTLEGVFRAAEDGLIRPVLVGRARRFACVDLLFGKL